MRKSSKAGVPLSGRPRLAVFISVFITVFAMKLPETVLPLGELHAFVLLPVIWAQLHRLTFLSPTVNAKSLV